MSDDNEVEEAIVKVAERIAYKVGNYDRQALVAAENLGRYLAALSRVYELERQLELRPRPHPEDFFAYLHRSAVQAYTPGMGKEAHLNTLQPAMRAAYLIGTLNYQVTNGGFMQWIDNGFGTPENVEELRVLMLQIGTQSSLAIFEMLKLLDTDDLYDVTIRDNREGLEELDRTYYNLTEVVWLAQVNAWLKRTFLP